MAKGQQFALYSEYFVVLAANSDEHDRLLRPPGAYDATCARSCVATSRSGRARQVFDDQDIDGAVEQILGIGITNYNVDDARPVGRALGRGRTRRPMRHVRRRPRGDRH
ncbi:hypothetical protein [Actinomadura fulvescens]|uniref:hypothetical protein n=1 Tax=Actinomadura fulvescens TaxID=46160 RepID=UPI0031D65435